MDFAGSGDGAQGSRCPPAGRRGWAGLRGPQSTRWGCLAPRSGRGPSGCGAEQVSRRRDILAGLCQMAGQTRSWGEKMPAARALTTPDKAGDRHGLCPAGDGAALGRTASPRCPWRLCRRQGAAAPLGRRAGAGQGPGGTLSGQRASFQLDPGTVAGLQGWGGGPEPQSGVPGEGRTGWRRPAGRARRVLGSGWTWQRAQRWSVQPGLLPKPKPRARLGAPHKGLTLPHWKGQQTHALTHQQARPEPPPPNLGPPVPAAPSRPAVGTQLSAPFSVPEWEEGAA